MDLPKPVLRLAHQKNLVSVEKAAKNLATECMKNEADKLIEHVKRKEPCNIEELDRYSKCCCNMWQLHGLSSKNGAVFTISVLIGKVLDFEIPSKIVLPAEQKIK